MMQRKWKSGFLPLVFVGALWASGCVAIDRSLLGLRSVAGGIHNKRQVSGIRPFFLPDGRLGLGVNGSVWLETKSGGEMLEIAPIAWEIDDPCVSSDGERLLFVSGREQVTAGAGHNDHVFQIYELNLVSGEWRRITESKLAEVLPRFTAANEIVFVRRTEYDGWSLENPWGPGVLMAASLDDPASERRLSEGLFYPFRGLELIDDTTLLFAGVAEGERPSVYALSREVGAGEANEPRLIFEGAYLPTPFPNGDLLVVRSPKEADGFHTLLRIRMDGTLNEELYRSSSEILGVAVSPDGSRIVFSDFDRDAGLFGEFRVWALGEEKPELLHRADYRMSVRGKPLDVIKPLRWWFDGSRSPGSR